MASKPIFDKILIANRGEIACRVIKTCRRLGIKSVAVYSTADEQAKHVKMADEALCIGPPTSKESYLRIDKIIDACVKSKANAVHPGYGFLSENSEFSAALKKNNIVFIGPDAHSIEDMGDKIHSKKLAKEAGVTTIPGFIGEITSNEQLLKVANEIGYPVMVKASGGGGGKGMRVANNDKEAVEFFQLCKEEAQASFGNDKMLVEKFIVDPKHIEVQIIADRCGNTLYLPERECSIQRRNQKVIEEAPSMFIDAKTRKAMGEQAVAMAKKVQYVTAGTVEMVVDPKRNFYFLEMNTRLQVEHPITELITGVDLVEQMIRASAGLPLSITQDSIKINGWATECRVYAEDPTKNYFPSIGRLSAYEEPLDVPGVRCDSGILPGSQISVYYDPLICKLSTWGENRNQSLERMRKALDKYVIKGLRHNVCLLRDVISQPRYIEGRISTAYLSQEYPKGFVKAQLNAAETLRLQIVSAAVNYVRLLNQASISAESVGPAADWVVKIKDTASVPVTLALKSSSANSWKFAVSSGDASGTLTMNWNVDFSVIQATIEGFGQQQSDDVFQFFGTDEITTQLQYCGSVFDVAVLNADQAAVFQYMPPKQVKDNSKQLVSPMPGVVVGIHVKVGDTVVAGQSLLTLEAMKMRNKLRAASDGKVKAILCTEGKSVEDEAVLIQFE